MVGKSIALMCGWVFFSVAQGVTLIASIYCLTTLHDYQKATYYLVLSIVNDRVSEKLLKNLGKYL